MVDRPCADRSRHSPHTRVEPGQPGDGAWCPGVQVITAHQRVGAWSEADPLRERVDAVLADLAQVTDVGYIRAHYDGCWRDSGHGGCLAARVGRTLRGER